MIKPTDRSKSTQAAEGPGHLPNVRSEGPIPPLAKLVREGYDFSELADFVRAHDPAWVNEDVPHPASDKNHVLPRKTR